MPFKQLFFSLIFLLLAACGSDNNNTSANIESKAAAELPASIQKLSLGNNNGTLRAYLTIDNDDASRLEMLIDSSGAGSASASIPGLARKRYDITISYEYTLSGITYIVAVATRSVDLASGNDSLSFAVGDYNFDRYDDDGDGYNNATELSAGTNPKNELDAPLPVANAITVRTLINTSITLPTTKTDAEGHNLTFIPLTQPSNGILVGNEYIPNTNFSGTDSFTYQLNDGIQSSTVAQVTINITQTVAFVTKWKTDNQGTVFTDPTQIKIGTNPAFVYNFAVDWGDGTTNEGVQGDITHTYSVAGTYTVGIRGDFPQPFFGELANSATPFTEYDASKIISIEQWGDIIWQSMSFAFFNCNNLRGNAIDSPKLNLVLNMSNMFRSAVNFNQDIGDWDVSNVKNMNGMFRNATNFNQDIGGWSVSAVTDTRNMFRGAANFNKDIGNWDVSSVRAMFTMFNGATAFNQDIGRWDVSSVVDIAFMFSGAIVFNQNIGNWDTSAVQFMDGMFTNATVFNQNIGNWDVSLVSQMREMFVNARNFNQNIGNWNVSRATLMGSMFNGARNFDQDISRWDVSRVINMTDIFKNVTLSTSNYDALLSTWSTLNLQNDIQFNAGNSTYSAVAARDNIINNFNWVITDGGQAL